ncbi:MAG TPA: ABC transporter permease, partial [Aggregatilineales bacterium]|nr:ABC transporter permease [Aggregatilineales bacterium]
MTTQSVAISKNNISFVFLRAIRRHFRVGIAYIITFILYAINAQLNERMFTRPVITSTFNQSMTLVFAGMAQTSVVLTGGIDLSVGPIISLSNSLASEIFSDDPIKTGLAILAVLGVGALCGLVNGILVVYGRLQPIIVTLATASVFGGLALLLRPRPGGYIPLEYSDYLTRRVGQVIPESWIAPEKDLTGIAARFRWLLDGIPCSLVLLIVVLLVIWIPFQRSKWGLWIYAVGSSEGAAYMSGVPVNTSKVLAYVMSGLFAAMAGLFLSAQTLSGDATTGAIFTLQSIAIVVLGGTSLFG